MRKPIPAKRWWLVWVTVVAFSFVTMFFMHREEHQRRAQRTRDETQKMATYVVQNEDSPREGASDTQADSLELASSLHDMGANADGELALTALREAYQLRRSLLGRFDTNTYASLAELANLMVERSQFLDYERTNALALLLELRVATTNLFGGVQAKDMMMNLQADVVSLYDLLGWQAEKAAAEKDWDQIEKLSDKEFTIPQQLNAPLVRESLMQRK